MLGKTLLRCKKMPISTIGTVKSLTTRLVIVSRCTCHQRTQESCGSLLFPGPYRVLATNGVSVRPVDLPDQKPIRVNLDRVTKCLKEFPDVSWLGKAHKKSTKSSVTPEPATVKLSTHSCKM